MLKIFTGVLLISVGLTGCDQTEQPDKTVPAESTAKLEPIITPPPNGATLVSI